VAKVTDKIREQLLHMDDGEFLGSQEQLLAEYGINLATLRQATATLMQEQMITSRRGVGGGFFARRPDTQVVTHIVALYLRCRGVALAEQLATLLPVRVEIARRAARSTDDDARRELIKFLNEEHAAGVAIDFGSFSSAERRFNRLLAAMSGSTTLTLFLEILFDLSGMVHREGDVSGRNTDRRHLYRRSRNLLADAVLARDEALAVKHAEDCSVLTWSWLKESRPDIVTKDIDTQFGHGRSTDRIQSLPPFSTSTDTTRLEGLA